MTGGCGFIGSNFIRYILTSPEVEGGAEVVNLDNQTYAGRGRNIEHMKLDTDKRYRLIRGDICDKSLIDKIFSEEKPDIVFNFAAESHVDRSIADARAFRDSNFEGVGVLLDASREHDIERFVQVSTDEVYGSTEKGSFSETDSLKPSSAYSACKAAADLLALSYFITHKLPVVITRSANNYGEYQFPEKLLPLFITNLIDGKKVPLMWGEENPGLNVRDWLNVADNCRAIWYVSQKGKNGEIYNIPGENERTNIAMTKRLLDYFGFGEEMIEKIEHRKGHDFRYSIDGKKLKQLGFQYSHKDLDTEL
ncbi:MAG: dTDP-glucose 4,6-dehydratase, partial [Nanoarchaeota archaeon]|nr:dTDP-glucose 4,6-dehydratase [Nanoarchaeota archaeon]